MAKTKKRALPKKQFKRRPKVGEFVVYRNRKGQITKPRGGVYLIAEIRNKKTGKVTGYLNTKSLETGKPNPQRFTAAQRALLGSPRSFPETEKRLKTTGKRKWKITSKRPVLEQIPKWVRTEINKAVKMNDEIRFAIKTKGKAITGQEFEITSDATYVDTNLTPKQSTVLVGIAIVENLNRAFIRMSPKKKGDKEQNKRRKAQTAENELIIMGF